MYSNFSKHIKTKSFFNPDDKILIAVSGGVDSMLLCRFMMTLGYRFSIAHIDHNTRNGKSHEDADFVRQYCKSNNIKFHFKSIEHRSIDGNFHNYAHKERYAFFDSLNYDRILTAHHKDDLIETILINIFNGRSAAALPEVNGKYIRPFLPYSKSEILKEAQRLGVIYVTDSSNFENNYLRNYLRNKVLINLEQVIPDYDIKLKNLSSRISEDSLLLDELATKLLPLTDAGDNQTLSLRSLSEQSPLLLYHSLKRFGINREQSKSIAKSVRNIGAKFYTDTHVLLVDRNDLIISKRTMETIENKTITLSELPLLIRYGSYSVKFEITKEPPSFSSKCNYFPLEKLGKSLTIRAWQKGDIFKPFGMGGKTKSVKKTFIDYKINQISKAQVPILIDKKSGGIMWILGIRSSHDYKCESFHQQFLKVEFSMQH